MKRWMVVVLVMMCLALGAGIQGFADSGADKVKAANLRAAQDYLQIRAHSGGRRPGGRSGQSLSPGPRHQAGLG